VALSTTEVEHNAVSESLRHVIHMMQLVDELRVNRKWTMFAGAPNAHCVVLKDNNCCCSMTSLPKMRPRTKHLGIKMHHFGEHVRKKLISIHKIPTQHQLANLATKAQPEALFVAQRESLMQWESEDKTRDELDRKLTEELLPSSRRRACEIIEHAEALNQHASLCKS